MAGRKRARNDSGRISATISSLQAGEEHELALDLFGSAALRTSTEATYKKLKVLEDSRTALQDESDDDAWNDTSEAGSAVDLTRTGRTRKLRATKSETIVGSVVFEEKLREFHTKSSGASGWAQLDETDIDHSAASSSGAYLRLYQSTGSAVVALAGAASERASDFRATRLKDVNTYDYHRSIVSSVSFHNSGRLVLSTGLDASLKFFKVEGSSCEKAHAVTIPGFPVSYAAFVSGEKVLAFGRRPFFYSYDVPSGRSTRSTLHGRHERSWERTAINSGEGPFAAALLGDAGSVLLLDSRTNRQALELKVYGDAWCASFSASGSRLAVGSSNGRVALYDPRYSKCEYLIEHTDEGSSGVTCVSCCDHRYAAGAASGVVNFYGDPSRDVSQVASGGGGVLAGMAEHDDLARSDSEAGSFFSLRVGEAACRPQYTSMNLTTRLAGVRFSSDQRLAAVWSAEKRDYLRIVDAKGRAVVYNWPTSKTPLSHVQCAAFSPDDAMLAIGNDKGRVLLYALE